MIGWLNEINRLASKGKREHREPPWEPPDSPAREPCPWWLPPGGGGAHPSHLQISILVPSWGTKLPVTGAGLIQNLREKLETHGEILSDLRFGREGRGQLLVSSREGAARLGQPLLTWGSSTHNSALPTTPSQPNDEGWEEARQALGAVIMVME